MTDTRPPLAATPRALGYAGLLPQVGAVLLVATGTEYRIGETLAFFYAALILSFLGGIWWGVAIRREAEQGVLAAIAVVPSLVALAIGILSATVWELDVGLVAMGAGLIFTLIVDRHLVKTGEVPVGWMSLRIPLSLGLGALTILAGAL